MKALSELLATGFYTGYLPGAPGTWGSFAAMLISIVMVYTFPVAPAEAHPGFLIAAALATIIGIITSGQLSVETGRKDPQCVVIDEWAGMFITYCLVPPSLFYLFTGFILFRFFDILKIWPSSLLEKLQRGWGIMMDDIAAGIYSALALYGLHLIAQGGLL